MLWTLSGYDLIDGCQNIDRSPHSCFFFLAFSSARRRIASSDFAVSSSSPPLCQSQRKCFVFLHPPRSYSLVLHIHFSSSGRRSFLFSLYHTLCMQGQRSLAMNEAAVYTTRHCFCAFCHHFSRSLWNLFFRDRSFRYKADAVRFSYYIILFLQFTKHGRCWSGRPVPLLVWRFS